LLKGTVEVGEGGTGEGVMVGARVEVGEVIVVEEFGWGGVGVEVSIPEGFTTSGFFMDAWVDRRFLTPWTRSLMKGRLSNRNDSREIAGSEGWIRSNLISEICLGTNRRRFKKISAATAHRRIFSGFPLGLRCDDFFIPVLQASVKVIDKQV
jgi:hypothetical protein